MMMMNACIPTSDCAYELLDFADESSQHRSQLCCYCHNMLIEELNIIQLTAWYNTSTTFLSIVVRL